MLENYIAYGEGFSYLIHSVLSPEKPILLFIHGLGDSHLSCQPYLSSSLSKNYNLLIPDLLGYGKSSQANNYAFAEQCLQLEAVIKNLQKTQLGEDSPIILIAHSMGGILATLLCQSALKPHIKGFINVEGSITQYGSFVASHMINAMQTQSFDEWFGNFKQEVIYENLASKYPVIRPYYSGLEFCDPHAFHANAIEMYQMSHALKAKYTHLIGQQYAELSIPRIYCYGDSLSKENIDFLKENQLPSQHFSCAHHFLLSECFNPFVDFIDSYAKQVL